MVESRPYTGWGFKSRVVQAVINLCAGAVVLYVFLYIFYRAGVALWFLGALAISCILFGLVLPFDREYSYRGHNFALHHVPEVGVIAFGGSFVGAYFHDWAALFLVAPVFLFFYEIMYIAVKMSKRQATWKQLATFTLFFTVILALGLVLGIAYSS